MKAYIAGPMFNPGEQWFQGQLDERVRRAGLESFLPSRDGSALNTPDDVQKIFIEDRDIVASVDVVVVCLNGSDVDSGSAWEVGWAYAHKRYIVGVYNDWRLSFKFQTVNVMIERSLSHLSPSLDDLESHLREYVRANAGRAAAPSR